MPVEASGNFFPSKIAIMRHDIWLRMSVTSSRSRDCQGSQTAHAHTVKDVILSVG